MSRSSATPRCWSRSLVIYFVVFLQLPPVKESIALPLEMYLSQRGFYLPRPELNDTGVIWLVAVVLALIAFFVLWWLAGRREEAGRPTHGLRWFAVAALLGLPLLVWFLIPGGPIAFENPELGSFNLKGGLRFTPEFLAMAVALALFTAAFIAEIIRGGIQAVSKGQLEAARTIGLKEGEVLRLVILPQALRIIIPPLTSQYLNLIKNSSLALASGLCRHLQRQPHRLGADRPAGLGDPAGDGRLSRRQPADLDLHELLQPPGPDP